MAARGPRPLFGRQRRLQSRVRAALSEAQWISLFLDYDGTLTPIAPTPEEAVLSARAMGLVRKLRRLPRLDLSIVSGRSLDQVRHMIPRVSVTIAANHGLQIAKGGRVWTHPEARSCAPMLAAAHATLRRELLRLPGIRMEDKGVVLAIHLRHVGREHWPEARRSVRKATEPFRGILRVTSGKMVMEIRPAVAWTKGDAILRLSSRRGRAATLPVFIGDDRTDEDGFAVLKNSGLTIRVGRSRKTRAQYYANGVEAVLDFLEGITRLAGR